MFWREASARLMRETTPCNHLPPKHRAGDGARSFYTSSAAMLHHPFKNNPPSMCTQLCYTTKADSSSGLPVTWTKGLLLKFHSPMELLVLALLVRVEGCGVKEVPSHGGDMAGEVKLSKSQPIESPNTWCSC